MDVTHEFERSIAQMHQRAPMHSRPITGEFFLSGCDGIRKKLQSVKCGLRQGACPVSTRFVMGKNAVCLYEWLPHGFSMKIELVFPMRERNR
jgi:hypothetical protein